jgi:hypothetical protein
VAVNAASNNVSVLVNQGSGTFAAAVNYATASSPGGVVVGDFNDDGKLDFAVSAGPSSSLSVFLNQGNGAFAASATFATGSYPSSLAAGDFNNDGLPDLFTSNNHGDTVSVLLNNGALLPDGGACDDGNGCTSADTCSAGVCVGSGNSCQNGGSCSSSGGSYTCACPSGYTGTSCETAVNLCTGPCPLPAWADDECTVATCDPATGVCGALDYYTHLHELCNGNTGACSGGVCHDLPPTCDSVPCANGGVCGADFYCVCPSGYTGTHCESVAPATCPCASDPIWQSYSTDGGICWWGGAVNGFALFAGGSGGITASTCDSLTAGGVYASTPISAAEYAVCAGIAQGGCYGVSLPCQSNPCQNGGTCVPELSLQSSYSSFGTLDNNYSCACPAGHTGTNCEL